MTDKTRFYQQQHLADFLKINQHNNSKISKRSQEENEKAFLDKQSFYRAKWLKMLKEAETDAQRIHAVRMLEQIDKMARWF